MSFFGNRPRVFLDPPIERCMIQIDAAVGHDLFEVAIRNWKADGKYIAYRITYFGNCAPLKLIKFSIPVFASGNVRDLARRAQQRNQSLKLFDTT